MEKKLKAIIAVLDISFTDFGTQSVSGIEFEFEYCINEREDESDRYIYRSPFYNVIISSNLYNGDIFVSGKVNAIKHIYKTLCKK